MRVNGTGGRGQRAKSGRTLANDAMHATHALARTNGETGAARAAGHVDEAELLLALTAFKQGNFAVRLPVEWTGIAGKISDTFNDVMERNQKMAKELERLSKVVGKEGKIH